MRRPLLIILAAVAIAASMPLTFRESEAQVALPSPGGGLFRTEVLVPTRDRAVRLEGLGITKIAGDEPGPATVWTILADEIQLESLARLGFRPEQTSAIGQLDTSGAGLIFNAAFRALVAAAGDAQDQDPANPDTAALQRLAQTAALLDQDTEFIVANLQAGDSDADGLTDTQESWWCTDPFVADSDKDGASDGLEAAALRAWAANDIFGVPASTGRAPSTGKPFLDWPMKVTGSPCVDSDFDSVPDLAERWELGLNANRESTDLDKFDDGQELFGITYCPGSGAFCGHGALPRDDTGGAFTNSMPSFVKAPGNHPMVAAFPIPEIDVVESSLRVQAVTTVTSSNTITEGTERSYSTSKTEGTSTAVADTVTWNDWQETSVTKPISAPQMLQDSLAPLQQELDPDFGLCDVQPIGVLGLSRFCLNSVKAVGAGLKKFDEDRQAFQLLQNCQELITEPRRSSISRKSARPKGTTSFTRSLRGRSSTCLRSQTVRNVRSWPVRRLSVPKLLMG